MALNGEVQTCVGLKTEQRRPYADVRPWFQQLYDGVHPLRRELRSASERGKLSNIRVLLVVVATGTDQTHGRYGDRR